MKFPQLRASPEDFMNLDTTAGGFPAFLGLVQQVQCSNGGDISHYRRGKSGLRNIGSKMSGRARRLFSDATGANEANSPK